MGLYNSIMLDVCSEEAHSNQNLMKEKYTKNHLSRQCNGCFVSCLTTFTHGNKLCSSVSEPSSASAVSCKSYSMFSPLRLLINNYLTAWVTVTLKQQLSTKTLLFGFRCGCSCQLNLSCIIL